MSITLRCRGRARNGRRPRWNDDCSRWLSLGHGTVRRLAVICAICGQWRKVRINLIEQLRQYGNIADIVGRQLRGDEFLRVCIKAEMQLSPPSARLQAVLLIKPFTLATHLQSGT